MGKTNNIQTEESEAVFTSEEIFDSLKYSLRELDQAVAKYRQRNADDKFLLSVVNKFVEDLTEKLEIERIGKFGDVVRFDIGKHTPEKNVTIAPQTEVMIIMPGFRMKNKSRIIQPVVRPLAGK